GRDGEAVACAISPDGRTVVFVASDSAGTVQLWARPLETLGARPIPGTDNAARPVWSPDSRWIGFFADGQLKKARPSGAVGAVCHPPNRRRGTRRAPGAT